MCGIAGMVRLAGGGHDGFDRDGALRMAETLVHRGPDGTRGWASPTGRCVLGHTRLEVIDLETGDQPMANEDGRVRVVFNGEIYNFRELRTELEAEGHRFATRSDTEVIVHGWEAWGEALPERLDGMFAFAVWDEGRGTLLLARDRAGKKPLHVARLPGRLLFASESKALLAAGVEGGPEPEAFAFYLAYGYVPAPGTFHRGISKLPPAHRLSVRNGVEEEPVRYWSLRWRSGSGPEEEETWEVRRRIEDAVRRRLVADVPLGAFLSGGVDSTVVVGVMSRLLDEPVRTFSLGFADDESYDETRFARIAAERFGTDHTEFTVEAHHVELVDDLVAAYDEPFGDSSAIPTWLVSRLTREHVTVALTGDGGDEMYAGYPRFLGAVLAERLPRPLVAAGRAVAKLVPHHADFRHPTRRFTRFVDAASLDAAERTLRWIGFLPERLTEVLRPEVAEAVDRERLLEPYRRVLREHRTEVEEAGGRSSPLARQLALNFATYLPEDLLVKTDRCSMAHGLELRSPFLDTAVMEHAAQLPDRLRIRRGRLKHVLKRAFSDVIPGPIADRGKMGFGVPLPLWFRTRWKGFFEARVLAPDARTREWLRAEPVEGLWREHLSGEHDHGHALWALLTLETWLRRHG